MGRLRMVDWIKMPEMIFAREIEKLENDSLFRKLRFGAPERPVAIGRSRWPRSSFYGDFDLLVQRTPSSGERVQVEELLETRGKLMAVIRKMGRAAFERYFLYGDEALPLAAIAGRTGLTQDEAERIHELVLEIGVQSEFNDPSASPTRGRAATCLASISLENGEPHFEFFAPHWARGRYEIHYDTLETWKDASWLSHEEIRRLPMLLRRIEIINLRQNTLFRIFDSLIRLQAPYLRSRREEHKCPISLRRLAQQLDLAPSTVCRAVAGRSVKLPWGQEAFMADLLPGRHKVIRAILSRYLDRGPARDKELAQRLSRERGIFVSRRTVNAIRHELAPQLH
ncbi:MAG: hypothetical protein HY549_10015 [Elusimicrobia bacterium]|nr:hypothetical protein [Elusimicrobiota bacterium]